jgi:hypothetical protein
VPSQDQPKIVSDAARENFGKRVGGRPEEILEFWLQAEREFREGEDLAKRNGPSPGHGQGRPHLCRWGKSMASLQLACEALAQGTALKVRRFELLLPSPMGQGSAS